MARPRPVSRLVLAGGGEGGRVKAEMLKAEMLKAESGRVGEGVGSDPGDTSGDVDGPVRRGGQGLSSLT